MIPTTATALCQVTKPALLNGGIWGGCGCAVRWLSLCSASARVHGGNLRHGRRRSPYTVQHHHRYDTRHWFWLRRRSRRQSTLRRAPWTWRRCRACTAASVSWTLVLASTALAAPKHAVTCTMDLAPPPHMYCSTRFMDTGFGFDGARGARVRCDVHHGLGAAATHVLQHPLHGVEQQ